MKKLMITAISVLMMTYLSAQVSEKLYYQALIRDDGNNVIANREIGMLVQVLSGSAEGTVMYAETRTLSTAPDGMISFTIGSGTTISGNFESIDWSAGPYFVKTEIDPSGGTVYSLTGTSQLLSVPYVFYAKTAEKIGNIAESQGFSDVLAVNDSAGMPIKNVADPTDDLDAVTMTYLMQQMYDAGLLKGSNILNMVFDIQGNLYRTVTIGDLEWMEENLRTTKYNDGTSIPLVTGDAAWAGLTTPGYCWYGNAASNEYSAVTCGALYNWYTVNTEKLCPEGWRVPTEEDLNSLITEFGGSDAAGEKLKEAGTKHWLIPNKATNESDFRALPGGFRGLTEFESIGYVGFWWTSTEASVNDASSLGLINNNVKSYLYDITKKTGMSVRCVADADWVRAEMEFDF